MDLWVIFLTGLTVGGLSCMVIQGGLLASTLAAREEEELGEGKKHRHNLWPTLAFLFAKLVAYTILGFTLGLFGKVLALSDSATIIMQLAAGVYMIAIALDLLHVHPIFRYAVIQPPKFLTRLVRNRARGKELFAPAVVGFMTVFVPCGTTLAMEALAISTGNPFLGALTMAVFTLGTMPLFLGLGFATTALGDAYRGRFLKLAAVAVLYLGVTSVNGALVASGSPITVQTLGSMIPVEIDLTGGSTADNDLAVKPVGKVQEAGITVYPNGYEPSRIKVKAGVPVKLKLTTTDGLGCTSAFRIPRLGISKRLARNSSEVIEFTPQDKGKLTFTCAMGMYSGVIEVI